MVLNGIPLCLLGETVHFILSNFHSFNYAKERPRNFVFMLPMDSLAADLICLTVYWGGEDKFSLVENNLCRVE